MVAIRKDSEAKIIKYLLEADSRGMALLREHYGSAIFGMISRMHCCPVQSHQILQNALAGIEAEIRGFSYKTSFFTWMMQVARKLSISYMDASSISTSKSTETAFSLIIDRGFNTSQAAAFLNISPAQVAIHLRAKLMSYRPKMPNST